MTQPAQAPDRSHESTRRPREESDASFQAYLLYEGMGADRTFPKLVETLKRERPGHYTATDLSLLRNVKKWSSRWGWRERVRAFDREKEDQRRRATEQALVKMNDDQALLAKGLQARLMTSFVDLLDLDQRLIAMKVQAQVFLDQQLPVPTNLQPYADPSVHLALQVRPQVRAMLYRDAVEIERLARGAATEIAQQQHAGGVNLTITTATPDGREVNTSPFSHDPNALLAADRDGKTADDDEDDTEDTAGDGAPDDADETSGPARPGARGDDDGDDTPRTARRRIERRGRPAAPDSPQRRRDRRTSLADLRSNA